MNYINRLRNILCVLLAIVTCLTLCACSNAGGNSLTDVEAEAQKQARSGGHAEKKQNVERFLYFTDPHYIDPNGWVAQYSDDLDTIATYYNVYPLSFVLCGGDWIYKEDTKLNACNMLLQVKARMTELFGDDYHLVLGNHDTNYQGQLNRYSKEYTGQLSHQTIVDLWYDEEGNTYYSFKGDCTTFYVFDTGIDWNHTSLDAFDLEQIEWYLDMLDKSNDAHIAISLHMLYVTDNDIHPLTSTLAAISVAYNERSTFFFGGNEYDFSKKRGQVEFMIAGHSHLDIQGELLGIPYIVTRSTGAVGHPNFDIVAVDYDSGVLYTSRIGQGEDRKIPLK